MYIPVTVEHDPRNPPVGRIREAKLVRLPDGEWGVEAVSEYFDPKDMPKSDGREVVQRGYEDGKLHIVYDFSYYSDAKVRKEIEAFAKGTGIVAQPAAKKAVVPLSELIVGIGVLAAGSFAAGFFGKLGSDVADSFKAFIKKLLVGQAEKAAERLLTFDITTNIDGRKIAVEVILTNPTDEEIDAFLESGLKDLDKLIVGSKLGDRLRKVVLGYSKGKFTPWFALREDGVPVFVEKADKKAKP